MTLCTWTGHCVQKKTHKKTACGPAVPHPQQLHGRGSGGVQLTGLHRRDEQAVLHQQLQQRVQRVDALRGGGGQAGGGRQRAQAGPTSWGRGCSQQQSPLTWLSTVPGVTTGPPLLTCRSARLTILPLPGVSRLSMRSGPNRGEATSPTTGCCRICWLASSILNVYPCTKRVGRCQAIQERVEWLTIRNGGAGGDTHSTAL